MKDTLKTLSLDKRINTQDLQIISQLVNLKTLNLWGDMLDL